MAIKKIPAKLEVVSNVKEVRPFHPGQLTGRMVECLVESGARTVQVGKVLTWAKKACKDYHLLKVLDQDIVKTLFLKECGVEEEDAPWWAQKVWDVEKISYKSKAKAKKKA